MGDLPDLFVRIDGPGVKHGRIDLSDLARISADLQKIIYRIARVLRGEPGTKAGHPEADIGRLCALELVGLEASSVGLPLTLAERERPFQGQDLGAAALDALVEGLDRIADENEGLPQGWDMGVVQGLRDLGRDLGRGKSVIVFTRTWNGQQKTAHLTPEVRDRIVDRIRGTVPDRREVVGQLMMADFDVAHRRCRIDPAFGPSVECRFGEELEDVVLSFLRSYVRATGEAELDLYGHIQRLHILDLEPVEPPSAAESSGFWDAIDIDELSRVQQISPFRDAAEYAAATWESDEELDEFMEELRRDRKAAAG